MATKSPKAPKAPKAPKTGSKPGVKTTKPPAPKKGPGKS